MKNSFTKYHKNGTLQVLFYCNNQGIRMFVDTHCHCNMMVQKEPEKPITDEQLLKISDILRNAQAEHVFHIINVGTSVVESENCIAIAKRYDAMSATVGIHPCDASEKWQEDFEHIKHMVSNAADNRIVAIGEVGLDFYHKPYDAVRQEACFRAHIELAIEYDLPLVVHIRDAGSEALQILSEYKEETRGVIHCFSLDLEAAILVTSWDWMIGIDGPVTYKKNDSLREIVRTIPLENNILLETDSPFLTPQKFRGKPNSPAYLPLIAEQIAHENGIAVEEVARITTINAKRLFKL